MVRLCGISSSTSPADLDSISSSHDDSTFDNNTLTSSALASLNPFADDGYEWPNLFEEIDECLDLSILIWPTVELRKRCREGKVEGDSITKIPLTSKELTALLDENFRLFAKFTAERSDRPRNEMAMEMLDLIHARKQRDVTPHKFTILHINDEHSRKEEKVVYWLVLDHHRRRLTLTFCWTSCTMDWASSTEVYVNEVNNPLNKRSSQPKTFKIHSGLFGHMFTSGGPNDSINSDSLSEFKEILQNHVIPALKKHPGYKLYTTGHGMGAALAILFAFQAGCEPNAIVPKPVTCVSIGGPYVGDEGFRQAHQLLESRGKLRHLRLTNHKDLVTITPKMSFKWSSVDKTSFVPFKHVGMNLRLHANEAPVDISFPKARAGVLAGTLDELARAWDNSFFSNLTWSLKDLFTFPNHSTSEYSNRLTAKTATLETLTLNDLYSRPDIVGNLVSQP